MNIQGFQFNLFEVNTYVVWNASTLEAAVIDPGMSTEEENRRLSNFIIANRLQVTALLNTHLHIDHVLGDKYVEKSYDVMLQASASDEFLGCRLDAQASMFHLPLSPDALSIDVSLNHGDRIYLGDEFLEVLEVPGHSPGSLAFYAPESEFVITGDALFSGSIGRTDLPGGDHTTLVRSVTDKLLTLPPNTVVYPGHGPATTIGYERQINPFL